MNCENRQLGVKTVKIAKSKNLLGPKRKHFYHLTDKISSEQLTKVEKNNRLGTAELQKNKINATF